MTHCPGCSHPFEAGEKEGNLSGEIGLTHDVTSDGKLWCSVCQGECPWIRGLQELAARAAAEMFARAEALSSERIQMLLALDAGLQEVRRLVSR